MRRSNRDAEAKTALTQYFDAARYDGAARMNAIQWSNAFYSRLVAANNLAVGIKVDDERYTRLAFEKIVSLCKSPLPDPDKCKMRSDVEGTEHDANPYWRALLEAYRFIKRREPAGNLAASRPVRPMDIEEVLNAKRVLADKVNQTEDPSLYDAIKNIERYLATLQNYIKEGREESRYTLDVGGKPKAHNFIREEDLDHLLQPYDNVLPVRAQGGYISHVVIDFRFPDEVILDDMRDFIRSKRSRLRRISDIPPAPYSEDDMHKWGGNKVLEAIDLELLARALNVPLSWQVMAELIYGSNQQLAKDVWRYHVVKTLDASAKHRRQCKRFRLNVQFVQTLQKQAVWFAIQNSKTVKVEPAQQKQSTENLG